MGTLTIIVPLWNEEGNIPLLTEELAKYFRGARAGAKVLLVNNGSGDATGALINEAAARYPGFIEALHFPQNHGYGGGVRRAIDSVTSDWVCWIPGDLQVKPAEVYDIWAQQLEGLAPNSVIKGQRISREDGAFNGTVSWIYTTLGRVLFGLPVHDLNALPKIFPRALAQALPHTMRETFVFDTEALFYAHRAGYAIHEFPVGWYKRHSGHSHWSNRRWRVYVRTFLDLIKLRFEKIGERFVVAPPSPIQEKHSA